MLREDKHCEQSMSSQILRNIVLNDPPLKITTKSFFPGKNHYIAIFPRGKGSQGERGLYYNETNLPPENQKILGPLLQFTFSYFHFVLINEIPYVGLPLLNLNIAMKKYNILILKMWFKLFHSENVHQFIYILIFLIVCLNDDVFTWSGDFAKPGRNIQLWRTQTWDF